MDLQRLLIDRMENRVLVGITILLATMVLVGWVAINEPGRMASFQEQHLARSVEIGAELFASSCATCHGAGGRGITGVAPGLNNPQMFGHDFFAAIDSEIVTLETAKAQFETITESLASTGDLSEDQVSALEAQQAALVEAYGENPSAGIDTQIANLNVERDALRSRMQAAVDLGYDPDAPSRPDNLDWASTLHDFVLTTLVGGRPTSQSYWPRSMPAWSQRAGGPLRDDQLENLTNYILNWGTDRAWTVDDLLQVDQFARIPVDASAGTDGIAPDVANIQVSDVEANRDLINETMAQVLTDLAGVSGDPNNGQALYNGALACSGCHNVAAVAPPVDGTLTRTENTRLNAPELAGYTVDQYLVESIIVPNAYVAPPAYAANTMPQDFGTKLTAQDLADLMAYLRSQDGDDPLAG